MKNFFLFVKMCFCLKNNFLSEYISNILFKLGDRLEAVGIKTVGHAPDHASICLRVPAEANWAILEGSEASLTVNET